MAEQGFPAPHGGEWVLIPLGTSFDSITVMSSQTPTQTIPTVQLGDQYRMGPALASGGAARIFLARQLSLDREVVVKVLRRQLSAQEEFRIRFAEEAKLLARLEHPNIVQVIDSGEQDGFYYFVMEYVRGGSLRDLLERAEHLPLDVALAIAYFAARSMVYMHEHHILHLDIKPANILLSRDGVVKVADFGLARLMDEQRGGDQTGHPAGTPLYMSPEQVQGSPLDARSDIFSFGIVLYQLLTFQLPFQGRSSDAVFREILHRRVKHPSELRESVPSCVDELVMTCLQRDRSLRYSRGESLIAEFHRVMEKLGIHRPEERVRNFLSDPKNYRVVLKREALDLLKAGQPGPLRRAGKSLVTLAVLAALMTSDAWLLPRLAELGLLLSRLWDRLWTALPWS